jgi:hypothetical protein
MSAMTSSGTRAGRGHLARLVVVAVLAGLALMMGVQCSDGMSTAMPMSHSTAMAMPMGEHEPDMGMGESLTMCLVLIVAVAVTAAVLTLPAVRTTVVAQALGAVARPESAQRRAPSLARLCSLRI